MPPQVLYLTKISFYMINAIDREILPQIARKYLLIQEMTRIFILAIAKADASNLQNPPVEIRNIIYEFLLPEKRLIHLNG